MIYLTKLMIQWTLTYPKWVMVLDILWTGTLVVLIVAAIVSSARNWKVL